jgi:N6-adenosine-specific RNA methylase IME4
MTADLFIPANQLYRCILADPPWEERGAGQHVRGAQRHYPLVPTREMPGLIRGSGRFTPDPVACHLWMWVTDSFLENGLWLVGQLGFRYVRTFCWVKVRPRVAIRPEETDHSGVGVDAHVACRKALQIGLGRYARGAHELLLLAIRGEAMIPPPDRRHPSVLFAQRREHSRKPDESYQLIEDTSPGPRLEMFARAARPGWDAWGNEAPAVRTRR